MLGKTELYFAPGEVQRVKANLIEGTTIVAVVVGFRNFEEAKWRAMVGLQGDKKFKLKADLKTLSIETMHGYGIAQHIQMLSADVLTIEEGSLYPALQRMLVKGWVSAEWKISVNNRRARFYTLTPAGRRRLKDATNDWNRIVEIMASALRHKPGEV